METILFFVFSISAVLSGVSVIGSRNPVNAAIFLALLLFFISGLFVLLGAFFLAAVQILIYAGAIMVLFLFVIMLLNISEEERHKIHWFGITGGIFVFLALGVELVFLILKSQSQSDRPLPTLVGSTEAIGKLLFSKYLLPFEITSFILLVAMVGVIVLSKGQTKIDQK